jgi:hypothetical protein
MLIIGAFVFSPDLKGYWSMTAQFIRGEGLYSVDQGLLARSQDQVLEDIAVNSAMGAGEALGPSAQAVPGLKEKLAGKTIAVLCAAGSLTTANENGERRIDRLNAHIDDYYVVAAGAGHYAKDDVARMDAALTNFSVQNSHTKAFKDASPEVLYLVVSHCATEEIEGNKGTLPHLAEILPDLSNVRIFHADVYEGQPQPDGRVVLGTGSGAPPAVLSVISALAQQAELAEPLDFELFGFDGTTEFIPGVVEELPPEYLERLQEGNVAVELDGRVYVVQAVFFDQMQQMAQMVEAYPHLIRSVRVDGEHTLSAAIFNTPDGRPRHDYKVRGALGAEPEGMEPSV